MLMPMINTSSFIQRYAFSLLPQLGCDAGRLCSPRKGKKESPFYHGAMGPMPSRPAPMSAVTICSMFSGRAQGQGPYAPYAQRFGPYYVCVPMCLRLKLMLAPMHSMPDLRCSITRSMWSI